MKDYEINPEPIDDNDYLVSYIMDDTRGYSRFHSAYYSQGEFCLLDYTNSFPVKPDLWIEMPDPNEMMKNAKESLKCKCCCGNLSNNSVCPTYMYRSI